VPLADPHGDDQLIERARLVGSRIVLGLEHDSDQAIALGVDLLVAGHDGPALVALASLPPQERWIDVEELARAALVEIGVQLPPPRPACHRRPAIQEDTSPSTCIQSWTGHASACTKGREAFLPRPGPIMSDMSEQSPSFPVFNRRPPPSRLTRSRTHSTWPTATQPS
jgi:hypothetical protein